MKKHRPRSDIKSSNPIAQALRNAQPIAEKLVQEMRLREWSALEAFAMGKANEADARLMLDLHCLCTCGIALGIGAGAKEACDRATEVLLGVFKRHPAGTPMRMDESELAVARELQDLHDQQRALATMGEYKRMLQMADSMIETQRAKMLPPQANSVLDT